MKPVRAGEITVEMQFLADVKLLCEDCKGKRFKSEILEVKYKEKSMFDILDMSVESALIFFKDQLDVYNKLKPLFDVGLGYVKLGQPSSTLSGGGAAGQTGQLSHQRGRTRVDPIYF